MAAVAVVAEVLSKSAPSPFSTSFFGDGTWSSLVMETGAASLPVPQADGSEPMSNSSTPPLASRSCGSEVEVHFLPLTFRPWT